VHLIWLVGSQGEEGFGVVGYCGTHQHAIFDMFAGIVRDVERKWDDHEENKDQRDEQKIERTEQREGEREGKYASDENRRENREGERHEGEERREGY